MYMYPRGFITGVENVCVCVCVCHKNFLSRFVIRQLCGGGGGLIIGCIFLCTGR